MLVREPESREQKTGKSTHTTEPLWAKTESEFSFSGGGGGRGGLLLVLGPPPFSMLGGVSLAQHRKEGRYETCWKVLPS